MTRRSVLGTGLAMGVGTVVAAESDPLTLEVFGTDVKVTLAAWPNKPLVWTVRAETFGPKARLLILPQQEKSERRIVRVKNASWPGAANHELDLCFDGPLAARTFTVVTRAWEDMPSFDQVRLDTFLRQQSPPESRPGQPAQLSIGPTAALRGAAAQRFASRLFGIWLSTAAPLLSIRFEGVAWRLSADPLRVLPFGILVDELCLTREFPGSPKRAPLLGARPDEPVWLAQGVEARARDDRPIATVGSGGAVLSVRAGVGGLVSLARFAAADATLAAVSECGFSLRVEQPRPAGDRRPPVSEGPFLLDGKRSALVASGSPAAPDLRLEGAIQLKEFSVATLHGRFDVGGLGPSRTAQVIGEARAGKRLRFEARGALGTVAVPLPDGRDTEAPAWEAQSGLTSRLDLGGQECTFRVGEGAEPPTMPVVRLGLPVLPGPIGNGTAWNEADWTAAPVRLPLGAARLRVVRPEDLLALDFRFRGLTLQLRGPVGRLVADNRACGVTVQKPLPGGRPLAAIDDRPMLVVDFPPQHVAERAYFRQIEDADLPDPKLPRKEVDDILTRDGPRDRAAEADRRRAKFAKLKEAEPKASPITFAEFLASLTSANADKELGVGGRALAERWSKLPVDQKVYLGPDPRLMEVDARGIATAIRQAQSRKKAEDAAGTDEGLARRLPDVPLPKSFVDALTLQVKGDQTLPEVELKKRVEEELQAERLRRDPDFADFAARYKAAFTQKTSDFATYRGREWFKALKKPVPKEVQTTLNLVLGQLRDEQDYERFASVTQARLAGVSRLAFRINCDEGAGKRADGALPFTLDALTNWSNFDLAVSRRAEVLYETVPGAADGPGRSRLPPRADRAAVGDQLRILAHHGVTPGADLGRRMEEVRGQIVEPSEWETAIELPFRLVLSPSQAARFRLPRTVPRAIFDGPEREGRTANPVELWSAALDPDGAAADMRAIWSPDFLHTAFQTGPGRVNPGRGAAWAPWRRERNGLAKTSGERFRTTLEPFDRHELVALTTLRGLPVLGRRSQSGTLTDGSQFEPPTGYSLAASLQQFDPPRIDQSAIYEPQRLTVPELTLTTLGGSLDLDTTFVPPAAARDKERNTLYPSLSIERWRHRTVLGRDILVEVVYKGFLFPIGNRCSLVKLTERRFYPHPEGGAPTAYLIQRMFLRIGRPDKRFPALGQPDAGRGFPAELVTFLTRRTPDILDPTTVDAEDTSDLRPDMPKRIDVKPHQNGRLIFDDKENGLVFWPRTARGRAGDVRFQLELDRRVGAVSMPLIFLDNVAANEPEIVEALTHYYNRLDGAGPDRTKPDVADEAEDVPVRRTVSHRGLPRRYAPEFKPGDTTHETSRWILAAQGRRGRVPAHPEAAADTTSDFTIDGFMEAADQPPFYPLLEKAKIRITPAERFTGHPLGSVWVQFDRNYIERGFVAGDTSAPGVQDANGAYLALLSAVPLSMGASGDRSGGVARPEINMIGLSRESGPIGGMLPASPPAAAAVAGAPPPSPAFATQSVKFDPAKFFNDDAKLLGIVSFSDLIKTLLQEQAPELLETVEHAVQQIEGEAAAMAEVARTEVIEPLRKAVSAIRKAWEDAARSIAGSTAESGRALKVEDLYPDVDEGLKALDKALLAAEQSSDALGLIASLGPIYESGRRFVAALDRIAADPVAPIKAELLDLLNRLATDAKALLEDAPAFVLGKVREAVETAAKEAVARVAADPTLQPLRDLLVSLPEPVLPAALPPTVAGEIAKAFAGTRDEILGQILRGRTPSPKDVLDRLKRKLVAIAAGQAGAVKQAVLDVADEVEAQAAAELDCLAGPLADRLVALVAKLVRDFDEAIKSLRQDGQRSLANVLAILRQVALELDELVRAVDLSGPLKATCDSVVLKFADYLKPAGKCTEAVAMAIVDVEKVVRALPAGVPARQPLADGLKRATATITVAIARYEQAREALINPSPTLACPFPAGSIRRLTDLVATRASLMAELLATAHILVVPLPGGGDWWAGLTNAEAQALRQPMRVLAGRLVEAARAALGAVADRKGAAVALAAGLSDAAKKLEETEAGKALSARVIQPALAAAGMLSNALDAAGQALDAADAALAAADGAVDDIRDLMIAIRDKIERELRLNLRDHVAEMERRLSAGAALAVLAQDKIVEVLQSAAVPLLQPIFAALHPVYVTVSEGRQKVSALPRTDVAGALLGASLAELIVVPEPGGPPGQTIANDALSREADLVRTLAATAVTPTVPPAMAATFFAGLRDLTARWHAQDPALARFVAQMGDKLVQVLRGNLVAIVDIQAGRRLVEERIKSLIPAKVTTRFDLDVPLGDVDRLVEFPDEADRNLTLHAKAEIDLLKPATPTFAVEGRVPKMVVNLLPVFDVASLTFQPTSFRAGTGRSPDFTVNIASVRLGEKVKFLEPLSAFLGAPEDGSGFYIRPATERLGIVAGYGLALPPFTIGNLGFSNVALNCACDLPFGPADARFLISIGSRDAPFVIAAAPYAGAGYVGLVANAQGIVGFEASLEYGGGGVFAFGPLKGEGRITVGIYIRQLEGFTELYGLFYCGGSARIACFSASSSFLVRLSQSGGSLQGEATYTFAFSLGFAKARFRIRVWKKESNGGRQENARQTALGDGRVRYAQAGGTLAPPRETSPYTVRLVNEAKCQGENWGAYASYFDMDGIGANL